MSNKRHNGAAKKWSNSQPDPSVANFKKDYQPSISTRQEARYRADQKEWNNMYSGSNPQRPYDNHQYHSSQTAIREQDYRQLQSQAYSLPADSPERWEADKKCKFYYIQIHR